MILANRPFNRPQGLNSHTYLSVKFTHNSSSIDCVPPFIRPLNLGPDKVSNCSRFKPFRSFGPSKSHWLDWTQFSRVACTPAHHQPLVWYENSTCIFYDRLKSWWLNPDIVGGVRAGAAVLSIFYVLMKGENKFYESKYGLVTTDFSFPSSCPSLDGQSCSLIQAGLQFIRSPFTVLSSG